MHDVAVGHVMLLSPATSFGRSDTVLQVCPPSAVLTAAPSVVFPTELKPTARQELAVAQTMASRWVTPESGGVLAQEDPRSVLTAAITWSGGSTP
jgi:hypothetical protein